MIPTIARTAVAVGIDGIFMEASNTRKYLTFDMLRYRKHDTREN